MVLFSRSRLVLGPALVLALVGGCGSGSGKTEVRVSAASSLTGAFTELEFLFEQKYPEYDVVLNLGASSLLREQMLAGAPADVFASANSSIMEEIIEAGLVDGEVLVFATNSLEIAVPIGNPGGVDGLGDFEREDLLLGLCARGVPCGDLAHASLSLAGVEVARHSDETNARSLLTKTAVGELDAGIVYVSDVRTNPDVEGVAIPDNFNQTTEYPISAISGGSSGQGAGLFIDFVLSDEGQAVLLSHGFLSP